MPVPVDYGAATGPMIEIALYRVRAEGTRGGTLIVNPGGPGESGVDFVRDRTGLFPPGFDIIGFDPRGTGRSNAVHCVDSTQLDELFAQSILPRNRAELDRRIAEAARRAASCLATDIGAHLGTVNVARDLDLLRVALGEDSITYMGFSYGARLGWTYAAMFPTRVRAMVLDGPEDPHADLEDGLVQQAVEFERLAADFSEFCTRANAFRCPDDPRAAIRRTIAAAELAPLPTENGAPPLSASYAFNAVVSAFYNPDTWQDLAAALLDASDGDGLALARLSYWWNENQSARPTATVDAIDLIWCADHTDRFTTEDYARIRREVAASAPTFGGWFPGAVPRCSGYPAPREPTPSPDRTSPVPILVIGATGDVATPYIGAQHLAADLRSGLLLTRDGAGHTSYGLGYRCIDDIVDRFLTELTRPQVQTCPDR